MDCLTDICFLCLKNNVEVQSVLCQDTDGIVVNEKLISFFPEIIDSTPDAYKLSCSECLEKLRISYDFKQSVIRNNTAFRDYIEKLQRHHKSHQQLTQSKHPTNLPVTRDDTVKKVEKCDEKLDNNSLTVQNENLNLTSTNLTNQDQLDTHDQSCQLTTNEHDMIFTKFCCQTEDINIKTENIEIDEIFIKEEEQVDDDFSGNYLDENSMESEDCFQCQNCPLNFSSSKYLETHTVGCKKSPNKLRESKRKVTQKDETISDDSFKCHICDNVYTIKSMYDQHLIMKHCIYNRKREIDAENSENSATINTESTSTSSNSEYNDQYDPSRPFKCSKCHKAFNTKNGLKRHIRVHTGEKPYKCPICSRRFADAGNRNKHKLTHTKGLHKCDLCNRAFHTKNALKIHICVHTREKPYKCPICSRRFTEAGNRDKHKLTHAMGLHKCDVCNRAFDTKKALKIHIRVHTREKPYKCPICSRRFTEAGNRDKHKLTHAMGLHKCDVCNRAFDTKKALKIHIRVHTREKPYKCPICSRRFTDAGNRNKHKLTHTKGLHKCDLCNRAFHTKNALKIHICVHTREKPYKCPICSRRFTDAGNRDKHKLTHAKGLHKCDVCNRAFDTKNALKMHIRVHTGEKPYKCPICSRRFTDAGNRDKHKLTHTKGLHKCDVCNRAFHVKGYLFKHIREHDNIGRYRCKMCSETFPTSCTLTVHMRTHTDEALYQCGFCQNLYRDNGSLKRHLRFHTGEKPYECSVCRKTFAQSSNLTSHMRVHTGEKPYQCDICEFKCTYPITLKRHTRSHT